MTSEEIRKQIEAIEQDKWENKMIDHWTREEFDFDRECNIKLMQLREELKKRGEE